MKILYATRLFSGLESSITDKKWKPTGVPTIYKIIKELDRKYDVRFIFSVKDSGIGYRSSWKKADDSSFYIKGLDNKITVLAGINFYFSWLPRKIAMIFREIRQSLAIIKEVSKFKPDIVYCDHANTIVAALLSRYQKRTLIVFRVMGVYPSMRKSLISNTLINRIFKWAYRSPFSLVICTQDGSGVELWLENALLLSVRREVLLNGIDNISTCKVSDSQLQALSHQNNIILYVGKLEEYKGCYEFVHAILLLFKQGIKDIHALVIGTGNEGKALKKLVEKNHLVNNFTFIERLPHEQIFAAHKLSDIYVSMNHLGNLSNSNLEAIQSNSCMVIPAQQMDNGIDVVTNTLLGNSVVTIPTKSPDILAKALYALVSSRDKREEMSKLIRTKKKDFLWSWDERVAVEMKLLTDLVRGDK